MAGSVSRSGDASRKECGAGCRVMNQEKGTGLTGGIERVWQETHKRVPNAVA